MAPLLCMEVMLTMGSRLHAIAQKLYSAGHGSTAMHGGHANHGQQTACHGGKTQYSAGHGSTAMHGGHANHGQQTACHGSKKEGSFMHKIGDQLTSPLKLLDAAEMAVTAATAMRVTTRTVEGTRGRAAEDISCNNQVLWDNFLPCDSRSTSSSFNTFIPWFIPRIQRPIQDMTKPSQVSSHFIIVVCHLNHLVKVIISSHSSNLKDVDYPPQVSASALNREHQKICTIYKRG
ncbi:hypothetical protein BC332_00267 [Capsicum chinense]|nr:hypothetical protein BC332_00267 [Capsicum chinense]